MVKVYIVRHAESVANTKGIYQGQSVDTGLSPLGKKQARALAKKLKELGIQRVITSPLKRTYQTALEISNVINCSLETNARLIEINHGVWEGRSKYWIKKNYPDLYTLWQKKPSRVNFPKGEYFMDTVKRVSEFLEGEDLIEGTVIVTHDTILRIMASLANGKEFDRIWDHTIEPAALNFFEVNVQDRKNKLKLLKLNDNTHLDGVISDTNTHAL